MIVLLGTAGVIVTTMVAVAMVLLTPHNLRIPATRPLPGPLTAAPAAAELGAVRVGSAP